MAEVKHNQLKHGIIVSINNVNYYVIYLTTEYILKNNFSLKTNFVEGFYGLTNYIGGNKDEISSYTNMLSLDTDYSKTLSMKLISENFDENLLIKNK